MFKKSPATSKTPEKGDFLSWLTSLDSSPSSRNSNVLHKVLSHKSEIRNNFNHNPVFKELLEFLRKKVEEKQVSDELFSPLKIRSPIKELHSSGKKLESEAEASITRKFEAQNEEILVRRKKVKRLQLNLKERVNTLYELTNKKKELQDQNHFHRFRRSMLGELENIRKIYNSLFTRTVFHSGPTDKDPSFAVPSIFEQAKEANTRIQDLNHMAKTQCEAYRASVNRRRARSNLSSKESSPLKKQDTNARTSNNVPEVIKKLMDEKKKRFWELFEKNEKQLQEIKDLGEKYKTIMSKIEEILNQQEPYLKDKIKSHIKKTLNLNQKKLILEFLQKTSKKLEVKIQLSPKRTVKDSIEALNNAADVSPASSVEENRQLIKAIQTCKIRINEFVANHTLKSLNEIIKFDTNIETHGNSNLKQIENLPILPLDHFYINEPDQSFSPMLNKLSSVFNHPCKLYFYLPKEILMVADKIVKMTLECEVAAKIKSQGSKKLQNSLQLEISTAQGTRKKQLSELQNLLEMVETESNLIKILEENLSCYKNQDSQFYIDFLKLHDNKPISHYVTLWKGYFQN